MNIPNNNSKKVDFIGAGDQRSGSHWIFSCLKEHPEVCTSSRKETRFFDTYSLYKKGIDYYYKEFFSQCNKNKTIGEYSPSYIYNKKAPRRIKKNLPNIKIIISIRNPVEKIYSLYWYNRRSGTGSTLIYNSFEEVLKSNQNFLERGKYYKRIKGFYNQFKKDQILIMNFDNLKNNPKDFISKIYAFINVDASYKPSLLEKPTNKAGRAKIKYPILNKTIYRLYNLVKNNKFLNKFLNYFKKHGNYISLRRSILSNLYKLNKREVKSDWEKPKMNKKTRQKLIDYYSDDIKKLENLTNKNLNNWKKL